MKFTKSNFTKDELDVIFYALTRYGQQQKLSLETFLEAESVAGIPNPKYIDHLRNDILLIEYLKDDLIRAMLSNLGSDQKPK